MKIKIKTEKAKFTLWFPTSLLCSKLTLSIALHASKETIEFNDKQKEMVIAILKKCKKEYKHVRLVDVETADGEIVQITV